MLTVLVLPALALLEYLPGDPRYGLQGEALKNYYRAKPAQWAIYCWDKPGREFARHTLIAEQDRYVKTLLSASSATAISFPTTAATRSARRFFMQRDDRAGPDRFVANEPMRKAGMYQRVEIHRWSNSFQKRAADYARKGLQQFLCTGAKTGTAEFFREHRLISNERIVQRLA